jgi:hypothetical protein
MDQSVTTPTIESAEITLRCVRCGYDLRGQSPNGNCPECGLSVEQSRQVGADLQRGRPAWLSRLSLGVWLLLTVPVVIFVVPNVIGNTVGVPSWILLVIPFAVALIPMAGLLLLTSREHRFERSVPGNLLRVLLRIGSVIPFIIAGCLDWLIESVGQSDTRLNIFICSLFLLVPAFWLLFVYLKTLARRIGNASLAEHCMIVATGLSICVSAIFVMVFFRIDVKQVWPVLVIVTMGFLFPLWSMYLLLRFAIHLRRAAATAKQNWLAADASRNEVQDL